MILPYRHFGCPIWFTAFKTTHSYAGGVVGKNKQFYSDCNLVGDLLLQRLIIVLIDGISESRINPSNQDSCGFSVRGNEGLDLVKSLKNDFIDLINPLFYN